MKQAVSYIFGAGTAPKVTGIVRIQDTLDGFIRVDIDIKGLENNVYGFHIHEKGACVDNVENPFAGSGEIYTSGGTMPPLVPSRGRARMTFYTRDLNIDDIIGRSLIIRKDNSDHDSRIACGIIRKVISGKKSYS